jgi:hypothetical protein
VSSWKVDLAQHLSQMPMRQEDMQLTALSEAEGGVSTK